jgi:hypothetical protein
MKHNSSKLLLLVAILLSWQGVLTQDLEKDHYRQLDNFMNLVNAKGINNAAEVISNSDSIITLCPSLAEIVKQFKTKKSEFTKRIDEKLQKRSQLDLSVQLIQIDGTVEAQLKGHSIINSNGKYYAVRINVPIGSTYKGHAKRSEGIISYKPLGGSNQNLPIYTLVSGGSPQEQHSTLTKEVENLQNQYSDLWEKFKAGCIREVSAEQEKTKQVLLDKHYAAGEDFLNKKEYDSALEEFNFVKTLNPDFKDIDKKLIVANNKNSIVSQSTVFQIVNPKPNYFLLGTSRGIFESQNEGRTWNLKAFDGMNVRQLDAIGERILAFVEPGGIQYSSNDGHQWEKLSVRYTLLYQKEYDTQTASYIYRGSFPFIQPGFEVKNIRLVPNENGGASLIFIEFIGKKGVYETENQRATLEKNWLTGEYYVQMGNEDVTIPERCVSPDDGNKWIAFWDGGLFGNNYHASIGNREQINNWIDNCKDYSKEPKDALSKVIKNISATKNVDKGEIKVIAYTFKRKVNKEDNDPVLVLTNKGLYKTCWDCKHVEEMAFSSENKNPLTIFGDSAQQKLIMIGLEGNGLLISRDGGLTWEEI